MKTKKTTEWIFQFWAWQLLIWALYRYYFHFPEWVDEFIFKPLVFVAPVIWYVVKREHLNLTTVGLTLKHGIKSIIIGLGIGTVFLLEGVAINIARYGSLQMQQLSTVATYSFLFLVLLSLATAFSEELLSRGFLLSRLFAQTKRMWYSIIMSTLLFVAFHVPILVTSLKFQGPTLILFFSTSVVIAVINSFLFLQTKSLISPLLVHFFWNMTVALFL
ncbi:MAG: CPBP family intramembrane glutamic endopeptidase [Candidatus Gottesmanbacteria bacterium]